MGNKKKIYEYYYLPFKYDIINNKFVRLGKNTGSLKEAVEEIRKLKVEKNG